MEVTLSDTQIEFLKIAKEVKDESYSAGGQWFNRKDVFIRHLDFMPYSTGLSLFNKGLLETDPAGCPAGSDLGFRITEKGETVLRILDLSETDCMDL